jgi:hypothetical protein
MDFDFDTALLLTSGGSIASGARWTGFLNGTRPTLARHEALNHAPTQLTHYRITFRDQEDRQDRRAGRYDPRT